VNPGYALDVYKSGANYPISWTNGTSRGILYADNTVAIVGTYSNHPLSFITNNSAPQVTLATSGNVGIGTMSPDKKLVVAGAMKGEAFYSTYRSDFCMILQVDRNMVLYDNGSAIWSSGTSISDIRLKKDIQELKGLLPKVLKWRAVSFKFKDPQSGTEPQIGLIAQEVEPAFPELIFTDKKGYKLIDYPKVTVVLLGALQEQQRQLEALQADLASLKQKIKGK
jgi:hypothetical protein